MAKLKDFSSKSGVVFGTSGARGLVSEMTSPICVAYCNAFLEVMATSFKFHTVFIGVDLRPSSLAIAGYCAHAISLAGFNVEFCGALPTPALALHSLKQGQPSIMVTGSHIPFDRNGLKFYRPDGEIAKADEIEMLDAEVKIPEESPIKSAESYALPIVNPTAISDYQERYTDFFSRNLLAGFKLGLYEHSSVARDVLKRILKALGAEVVSLARTDIFVPIDTEAVSDHDIALAKAWSSQYGFDAIISTDGDGDRPLLSDEHGNWLRGDIVGLLCARFLGIQKLAVPISCNTAIELSGGFNKVVRTKIGSPYVIAAMQSLQNDDLSVAGFEANGGFLLGSSISNTIGVELSALPTRDAILPVLAVLASARQGSIAISDLLSGLPQRYTASDRIQNIPAQLSQKFLTDWANQPQLFCAILDHVFGVPISKDTTDGLRFTFKDGVIIHLRASGNAPELRCYSEASSQGDAHEIVSAVLLKLQTHFLQTSV